MSDDPAEIKFQKAVEFLKPLENSMNNYNKMFELIKEAMQKGLGQSTNSSSSIKMYPSYVTKIPNGTEKGEYLVIDLGESLYRVLVVKFQGPNQRPEVRERTYTIPQQKLTGTAKEFFGYLAETLKSFMISHGLKEGPYLLGFTFSFPCITRSLTNAVLQRWTKCFKIADAVGRNPGELLQKAADKAHLPIKCAAIINDTVGTLASCAVFNPQCAIALICGNGTNAAYIEAVENVELMTSKEGSHVIINTEMGGFGDLGELDEFQTPLDRQIDDESLHPKTQIFEKMIAGMYLAEQCRVWLYELSKAGLLFNGLVPESLSKKGSLTLKSFLFAIREPPEQSRNAHHVITQDLSVERTDPEDIRIFRYVCDLISKRSAYFLAAGTACLLHRMNRSHVIIGTDGSMFKFHPKYTKLMSEVIDKLKPPDVTYEYRMTDDGSGLGAAAIVAALGHLDK